LSDVAGVCGEMRQIKSKEIDLGEITITTGSILNEKHYNIMFWTVTC